VKYLIFFVLTCFANTLLAQEVPSRDENVPFLVTFSAQADKSWGDDDYTQVFFFVVPLTHKTPVYFRVFDADVGGVHDELKGTYNSTTKFSVYGGKGCISDKDARGVDPVGNYKSGNLLASKTFANEPEWDNTWYTFGPFDPANGELQDKYGGYVFKIVVNGLKGDDGNLYRFFMSTEKDNNKPVEGGNAFTFEYSFRLHDDSKQISHIYPYVDAQVESIKQSNFDWDNGGLLRVISKVRKGDLLVISGDNKWATSMLTIKEEERNASLDIQIIKSDKNIQKNNVVMYITNQYGEYLPFYSAPIGGIPKYKYTIGFK